MKQNLLLVLIALLLSGAIEVNGQEVRYPKRGYEAGIFGSIIASYNKLNPKPSNLHLNMYNGGELGGYISYQRNRIKPMVSMSVMLVSYGYEYTHPLYNSVTLKQRSNLSIFNHTLSLGIIVARQKNYAIEIAPTLTFTFDMNKNKLRETKGYSSAYDTVLQADNNKLVAFNVRYTNMEPFNASVGLSVSYQRYKTSSWFVRAQFSNYRIAKYAFTDKLEFYALDANTNKVVQTISLNDNRLSFNFTFGWRLWKTYNN